MKAVLMIIAAVFSLSAFSQKTEGEQFVVLHTGEKITGQTLLYDSPILKQAVFRLDDRPFETPAVAFFQNNHGFFANLNKIYGNKAERYALRIRSGKVNVYEEIEMSVYGKENLAADGNSEADLKKHHMLASGETFQYYSVGNREVKRATVRNMKVDLADNVDAMHEIGMIRKYQVLQGLMIGAGAALIAYDIIKQSGGAVRFNPMMAVGIVVGGSAMFLESAKDNARWLAIDAYNK
jgi:hypothetical protein